MKELFKRIPQVDRYLEREELKEWIHMYSRSQVADAIRNELDDLRTAVLKGIDETEFEQMFEELDGRLAKRLNLQEKKGMRSVINATGTILHTNLGRAPIHRDHMENALNIMSGYSNLEYDLLEGRRGQRYGRFEELMQMLTGCEAAIVVNNNAAGVLLMVNALCKGREVLISRGELVEIGGKFRIPEVIEQGGAILKEVGTTNKTRLEDYERGINENTAAILKVHTSNFRMEGFTESVQVSQLKTLGIPVLEDLGSGCIYNLENYGIRHETTVKEALENGSDVVCFSGDKLLGGSQAGIIVGKKDYLDKIRTFPLMRAVRPDKFTIAVLQSLLESYVYCPEREVIRKIPVLSMLTESYEATKERAYRLKNLLHTGEPFVVEGPEITYSEPGGGSLPGVKIKSSCIKIGCKEESLLMKLEKNLRLGDYPVVVRMAEHCIIIDMRTVPDETIPNLSQQVNAAMENLI